MKKFTTVLIVFFLFVVQTFGQSKTTAEESSDDLTEFHLQEFQKQIEKNNVKDFFAVKHVQYGASITSIDDPDYCEQNKQYRLYAFWKESNSYWLKVFDNCGGFIPIKLKDKSAVEFYIHNYDKLKFEEVENYKTKPDSISNRLVYSFRSYRSHSPLKYFWFYKNSTVIKKYFDEYSLETNKTSPNINHKKNHILALVKLNEICNETIERYAKSKNLKREK